MQAKPPLKIVLCSPRGFCAGVVRAIDTVERALTIYGAPVYVRHEIVHNRYVLDSLRTGVDIVAYSGDKLLGGPQAGLISGRADLVARMRSNSLFRALRVDKLTYAALEATLLAYVKHDHDAVPVLRMMRLSKEEITQRAEKIISQVEAAERNNLKLVLLDGESVIGGGAAPSAVLATRLIAMTHASLSANQLNEALRQGDPPVIARVDEGRVLVDLRTVFPGQDGKLISALGALA